MTATLFGRVRGPIIIDLFAGGGGASAGIRAATGYSPVVGEIGELVVWWGSR